jgi:hypothetical protein
MEKTLIIHALGAPVGFSFISYFYFTKFRFTPPLQTAFLFLSIVITLDVFVVALLVGRSFSMFKSPPGTWIPFLLISLSTYFTGVLVQQRGKLR